MDSTSVDFLRDQVDTLIAAGAAAVVAIGAIVAWIKRRGKK